MNKSEVKKRIEKLKKLINHHRYLYHALDRQEISESALDSLKKELFDLEQKYPEFITSDSPTQRIGGIPLKKFKKAIFSFSLLVLFIGIIFFSLFIFKPETGIGQEAQKPKIIFQEARQWQITADATENLRPESDGDVIQLTPNTGTNWDAVNEASSDGDGAYVQGVGGTKGATQYDLYNLSDSSKTGTINSVTVYINAKSAYKTGTAKTVIKTGGSEDRGAANPIDDDIESYVTYSTPYTTNPIVGGAWTWTQVNALQIGVEMIDTNNSASTDLRCTQVWAVVDYVGPAVLTQKSYRWQNDDGDSVGNPLTGGNVNNNTNSASADTSLEMKKGERAVWRVQVDNTGDFSTTTNYKVQWATTTDVCTSSLSWADLGAETEISYSSGLSGTNGESLTTSTCASNSNSWTNGKWFESTSTIGSFELVTSTYTEFGFMIETSNAATNTSYCLRLYNQGSDTTLNSYDEYGKLTIVSATNKKYSKDSVASLSSTTTDLTYFLDSEGYDDVGTNDSDLDAITSSSSIPVFLFDRKHTNNTDEISISWNGSTTVACDTKAVYLQVYNNNSSTWETFASSTTCSANEDFTLSYNITTNPNNYYDANYWNYIRVYQDSGTQTLKTNYINIIAYLLDISGTVYIDEGDNGSTLGSIVHLVINSSPNSTTTASTTDGSYSFSDIAGIVGGDIITVFLDDSSEKGVTVTRLSSPTISGFDIYKNRVIVRHEDSNPLTISDLDKYDSGQDADILFTATTGPDTLSVNKEAELYIWPNKEFAPGGNVTLDYGGSGDEWDGSLKICSTSTFTASSTESHSIGGSWFASSTATFASANSTIIFTATTTGKTITTAGNSFYSLTFDSANGGWTFLDAATTTNNLTSTQGTATSSYNMTVLGGAVTGNGTLNWTGGTFLVDGTGNFGGTSDWTFYNLTFGDGSGITTTTATSTATTTISNVLTIDSSQTLNAGTKTWVLSDSGTPFIINGAFKCQTSTFKYTANDPTYITEADYYNLELVPGG